MPGEPQEPLVRFDAEIQRLHDIVLKLCEDMAQLESQAAGVVQQVTPEPLQPPAVLAPREITLHTDGSLHAPRKPQA